MKESITDPLWDLMLSTNDCYPGCACDDDYFQITEQRIGEWIKRNGIKKGIETLKQLDEIEITETVDYEDISIQTNIHFESHADFTFWISEWRGCIQDCIKK